MTISTEVLLVVGSIVFTQFVISAILIGVILKAHFGARKAANWSSTKGIVLLSQLVAKRSSKGHYVNYPMVMYQYHVDGTTFESQQVSPGMAWGGTGAIKVVEQYPIGSQVTVFYNPAQPSTALLERKPPTVTIWLWITLVIVNLFFCGMSAVFYFAL